MTLIATTLWTLLRLCAAVSAAVFIAAAVKRNTTRAFRAVSQPTGHFLTAGLTVSNIRLVGRFVHHRPDGAEQYR